LEGKILTSKTVFIEQRIDGEIVSRPVIIETSAEIDHLKSYPIVIALHGRGGSNKNWIQPLSKFTNSGEFIGVYPQGHLNSWNLGQEPSNANDVAFISSIIDTLLSYSNVDENKIFAVGNSNGSGMVNVLGGVNKRLKAIAPVASQLTERTEIKSNAIPLSIFQVNGDQDILIPIDGGMKLGHPFLSASDSAKKWATHFNCNHNVDVEETEQTILHTYSDCDDNVVVKYLVLKGLGHNIARDYSSLWNDVWDFFSSLD
jgi:poly(3-hydroxybutyrate) depolymerase